MFNPGRQLSTTQHLTASSRMEQRIRQIKVRTLMDWDKDSLIGKAKTVHTIHSLQLAGKCLTNSRKVGFIMLGKTNTLSLNVLCCVLFTHTHTPIPSHFPYILLQCKTYGMGYHFCQFWPATLSVSPPSFLFILSLVTGGAAWLWETEGYLMLCKHCSGTTRI